MSEHDFWLNQWRDGQIGFHEDDVNPWLTEHIDSCNLEAGEKILVPLCGKTKDLAWLASKGFRPFGVELSPIACAAVFDDLNTNYERTPRHGLTLWHGDGVALIQGDFFHRGLTSFAPFDAFWDRAALVALPPTQRQAYVKQCARLLAPGRSALLVTLHYEDSQELGPPYSLTDAEILELYRSLFECTRIATRQKKPPPHLEQGGIRTMSERAWLLRRKSL